jgi:hypothetical protein
VIGVVAIAIVWPNISEAEMLGAATETLSGIYTDV